ncbi:uncharacterized protein LOC126980169 isoform X2 [Leptidea sinapis]|uniref:uncharacterized protein LOC126980169 isoform X2 n=1 Tax=Leptidea sinapis TaxID=189913 RepID=UPI0021C2E06B|nr:uncharacterized protein LOC126980169 isoform X2 [Leptidea sinapis]
MKTKQPKEETDKSIDDEPKTRARKKASDLEETKFGQDESKPSQEVKKTTKPKAVVKKRPLGIRKTTNLKGKKTIIKKNVLKASNRGRRGRKPAIAHDKESIQLISASEIKKEPTDDTTPNSRSSSPRTAGRKSRLSSDMVMMKSVLGDSPSTLVLGPRTSPYSMRSERSNSPSLFEGKKLRSGKPRKVKNNLLNEVVIKEQKKRRRLLSDARAETETSEDGKKLKRGRSCSRDGSEISKCSDITESDISLNETLNEIETKELITKTDKIKTDVDIDSETNVQNSTIAKVPSLNDESKSEIKPDAEPSSLGNVKDKRRLSLKRSTSLDSDNNNSNRIKINNLNSSDVELKIFETESDTLLEARNNILNCMSKTFNSKEVSKNIRKARRGRKAAAASKPAPVAKNGSIGNDLAEDKNETVDTLSKEISDLINDLDQNIESDHNSPNEITASTDPMQTKAVRQFYGLSKPLGDNNSIVIPETPVKDKETVLPITVNETTPSKIDDSENIKLHYEEGSSEKCPDRQEVSYKRGTIASIDKLMDRLKEFEEFDKRRQRQESESKSSDSKSVMVTNDVVLIPKSGADIKPLKDIQQPLKSPEKIIEKENVLSCFENNSAISIVKRDHVRRSIDVDLPNSVTLIKRNSINARKESTSSNHSRESDAISIFEKSLGKDVTLTEIRKSVEKGNPSAPPVDLHQLATLHPNNPTQTIGGMVLDSSQISITPRNMEPKLSANVQLTKRKSRDSVSWLPCSSGPEVDDKMATIEKIKSPSHVKSPDIIPPHIKSPDFVPPQIKSPDIVPPHPVAMKSPESTQPMETEALAPPLENVKEIPDNIALTTEVTKLETATEPEKEKPMSQDPSASIAEDAKTPIETPKMEETPAEPVKEKNPMPKETTEDNKNVLITEVKQEETKAKTPKPKSARNSTENHAGPSNMLQETPESQKRKENVLRTLGLLTHKAANEAKIEKQREKERIYGPNYTLMGKGKASKSDYTGTLKAVIKLNRGAGDRDKKKNRSSLKMTFQKSKNRSGKPPLDVGEAGSDDDSYYTIENREVTSGAASDDAESVPEPEPKETLKLVIPEKASSFSIHPGRLCMDQCFYCGGKFGLFDTPCHIAQMKSGERQKKVLDNEEKLTIDSCLCDACYRHVDRRANCPSYRKRPFKLPEAPLPTSLMNPTTQEKPSSPPMEEESEEEPRDTTGRLATCHVTECVTTAAHSIRRKWLIKMRSSVNKLLKLGSDYPGLHTIPLCADHYRTLSPLMACVLCRRRLTKHHNLHFIHHGFTELNPLLKEAGVPVEFTSRPVLCKMCRYYCTLLQRPDHDRPRATNYRRKLLQIYNVELPPELEHEIEETTVLQTDETGKAQKKKARTKSKQRKSTEPECTPESESLEQTTESSPEKEKEEADGKTQPLEEDIESLISLNKIPVPGAKPLEPNHSDASESEMEKLADSEMPLVPLDKQTELRYLLQKQNNPAQFQNPNLTQKSKNILKIQNVGIQKVGQQQRISDKNAKRIQKIGQILAHKEKPVRTENELEIFDPDKAKDVTIMRNISLNDECTIETIPNKKPADINLLKNKWHSSESFCQVKKNLSELSKKYGDKEPVKKSSDQKYSNPVKRLETNPSISVRELFPGEEEMNLQCNIEFNNIKGITPEGWEKCNSMIQYDIETKKLWAELQRPYGNQSSFLRHLILLEKYFRSGDLVLTQNASPHAANYSNSVQSRIRSYDNKAPEPTRPQTSLIEFRKKPSINGKSLLKSSQNSEKKTSSPEFAKPKPKEKAKAKPLPPELIAINTPNAQGRKVMQNVLHNIQQLVKGVTASDPTEVASAPLPPVKFNSPKEKSLTNKLEATKEPPQKETSKPDTSKKPDTPKKQKAASKSWRPKLMPITQENLAKIAREPLKTAVDGHSLPSLVQVLSNGNRYHITFEDYNKMCIIRKERQQRLLDKEAKTKPTEENTVITEIQTSTMLGNGGTVMQNITPDNSVLNDTELQIGSNAATILKNVGLKNITIAPIPAKTATVTSQILSPPVSSPSILSSTSIKIPQLGPSVSITAESVPFVPPALPKIPKALTVIPQTIVTSQASPVVTTAPSQTEQRP